MADFKKAWEKTSKIERGYVNNSADRGGETYRGISRVNWPKWEGWNIIAFTKLELGLTDTLDCGPGVRKAIDDKLAANEVMKDKVESFYKTYFWDALELGSQPSQAIAEKVFDIAVNMGVTTAKAFLEEALKGDSK